jgi:hypothetical protein
MPCAEQSTIGFSSLAAQKTLDCTSWHTHLTLLHNLGQSPDTTMVKSWEMTDKRHLGKPEIRRGKCRAASLSRRLGREANSCDTTMPVLGPDKGADGMVQTRRGAPLDELQYSSFVLRVVQQLSFSSLLIV